MNTVLWLHNAAGTALVPETSDAASPATSLVSFVPTTAGTYYVKARDRTTAFAVSAIYNVQLTSVVVPRITTPTPATREAGYSAFTLVVKGTGFAKNSVVRWKGSNRTTLFVSAAEVRASITKADIASAGVAAVTVYNPTAAILSSPINFTITTMQTAPLPTITSLAPTTRPAGSASFVLIVRGTNFVPRSYIRWGGAGRVTTFISATELRTTLTTADVAAAGTKAVSVVTASPGGGFSNAKAFTISQPVTPCTMDEPNNTIATAKQFTPLGSTRNYAFCAEGDEDFIWINGAANTKYHIEVLNPDLNVDAVVVAYNPDGSEIGRVNSGWWGAGEDVELTTDIAGRYAISFHDVWSEFGPSNTYSVKISLMTGITAGKSGPASIQSTNWAAVRTPSNIVRHHFSATKRAAVIAAHIVFYSCSEQVANPRCHRLRRI